MMFYAVLTNIAPVPPTPEITLDSGMEMVYAGGSVRVSDGMSTVDGPFCYVYQ